MMSSALPNGTSDVPTSMAVPQSPSCGVLWALTPIGFVGMNENEKGKQAVAATSEAPPTSAAQGQINGLGPIVSNLDGTNMRQLPANAVPQTTPLAAQNVVLPSLGQIPNAMPAGQFVGPGAGLLPFVLPYGQMANGGGIVLPGNGVLDANAQLGIQTAAQTGIPLEALAAASATQDAKNMPGLADLHRLAQLAMVQGPGLTEAGGVKGEHSAHQPDGQESVPGKPAQEKGENRKQRKASKENNAVIKSETYANQVEEKSDEEDSGDEDGDGKKGSKPKRKRRDRSKSVWWTPEEHQKFLEGLAKFGSNDSLGPGGAELISLYMGTRSVLQVRSHAQKHFLRTRTGKT